MNNSKIIYKMNAKDNCFVEKSVVINGTVTLYPNNIIVGKSVLEDGVTLFPNNIITNCKIGKNSTVACSVLEDSVVLESAKIGPFSHLRPNCEIGENAKIGNFVEIKNSRVGKGSKVSHLSYVGDADVGENVNIGCGVVFVNYNGKTKSRSTVKNGAFVGSSVNVIAPVTIGEKAFVCAGTNVDKNVDDNCFAIGRSRMQTKPEKAKKYLEKEN